MRGAVQICLLMGCWNVSLWAQLETPSTTVVMPAEPTAEVGERGYSGLPDNAALPVQVRIISPVAQEILPDNPVDIFFEVENYSLAEAGNRLHVIIDNEPPRPIWNLKKPLTLRQLPEGGHSIRVLLVKPDGLALSEPGAFAMTTFFLRRKGFENFMSDDAPILTVNQPGNGFIDIAEGDAVWFDFKTVNAPLAKGGGYSIQYRLNRGEGIITDEKPIYWTQVKPGRYELTAQLVDNNLQPLPGVFNTVKRVFEVRLAPRALPLAPAGTRAAEPNRPPPP